MFNDQRVEPRITGYLWKIKKHIQKGYVQQSIIPLSFNEQLLLQLLLLLFPLRLTAPKLQESVRGLF